MLIANSLLTCPKLGLTLNLKELIVIFLTDLKFRFSAGVTSDADLFQIVD